MQQLACCLPACLPTCSPRATRLLTAPPPALPTSPLLQVIQARLAALEEDNHKADDVAAGSDDEEFELPKGSDEGGWPRRVGAAVQRQAAPAQQRC
jgi:hypothetical protein